MSISSKAALLLLLGCFCSSVAVADTEMLSARIKHSPLGGILTGWSIRETAVKGYYALKHPSGQYEPYYADEALQYIRTNKGWHHLDGHGLRHLTASEEASLFQQMMPNLRSDKGIALQFGSGSETKTVLLSAFDCPSCRKLEHAIEAMGASLNASVILFPSALDNRNQRATNTVAEILCEKTEQRPLAWRKAIHGEPLTARTRNCDLSGPNVSRDMAAMFGVRTVPAVITADGVVYKNLLGMAPGTLMKVLSGS